MDPYVWYKEETVLLFYVDDCLMFSTSKDKIYELYASLQAYFKIEDNGEPEKYPGIDLYRHPDISIPLRQPYPTQRIINITPGMKKSSDKPTPVVKPPLAKN